MSHRYEVIVGNIGSVYYGPRLDVARDKFNWYAGLSTGGAGRAAGESVTLMEDGEILDEFQGENEKGEPS